MCVNGGSIVTRSGFKLISEVIRGVDEHEARHKMAMNFAVLLKRGNQKFDVQKFMEECCVGTK